MKRVQSYITVSNLEVHAYQIETDDDIDNLSGDLVATLYDWIVELPSGNEIVLPEDAFEELFRPATGF